MAILDSGGAHFPLVETAIAVGERVWRVTAVKNQDALLEAVESLEHMPYGFLLWESAVGLARLLAAEPGRVFGKRVLELGCGVGFPGIVARSLGAHVWQTDHQTGAMRLAKANAEANGVLGIEWFVADWRNWDYTTQYDVILGADILYERAMHPYLEVIFQKNLAPGGSLLIGDPVRPQAMEFAASLEGKGWSLQLDTRMVSIEDANEDQAGVEVALITASRRAT